MGASLFLMMQHDLRFLYTVIGRLLSSARLDAPVVFSVAEHWIRGRSPPSLHSLVTFCCMASPPRVGVLKPFHPRANNKDAETPTCYNKYNINMNYFPTRNKRNQGKKTINMLKTNKINNKKQTCIKNIYNHIVNTPEQIVGLEKVPDQRGLSVWTNKDKRWSQICNEYKATPKSYGEEGKKNEDIISILPNDKNYATIVEQAENLHDLLEAENISQSIPIVIQTYFTIEKYKINILKLKKSRFKYKTDGDYVNIELIMCFDSGADCAVGSNELFSILKLWDKKCYTIDTCTQTGTKVNKASELKECTFYLKNVGDKVILLILNQHYSHTSQNLENFQHRGPTQYIKCTLLTQSQFAAEL